VRYAAGVRWAQLAVVLGVVAAIALLHALGVTDAFADPPRLKQTLLGMGAVGYLAFVGGYAVLQPFGVPGTVFIVAAPLIWPWPVAFALSMVGTMAASVVGFSFARFLARDWVLAHLPARFRRYEEALERRGFATVFALRLIFWMPPVLHFGFGVSRVPFWTHFWASMLGYVLPLLLVSYFGGAMVSWMAAIPAKAWLGIALAVALTIIGLRFFRRARS
jgi:uncharacterized membrane protein YdjX (TVP38/TMEM64 family)